MKAAGELNIAPTSPTASSRASRAA